MKAQPVNRDANIHFDLPSPIIIGPVSSNNITKTGVSQLSLSQAKRNVFVWNDVVNIDLPDGRTIAVDRKSWIFKVEELDIRF